MNQLLRRLFYSCICCLASLSIKAQQIVDPCFSSVELPGQYYGSDDLKNACGCLEPYTGSDLLEWDGDKWNGQLPYADVDLPPPPGGCNIRAIWMGYEGWTGGGEGFALRLDQPLQEGESYTYTFTYAREGTGNENNAFSPMVYTGKYFPFYRTSTLVGSMPGVGNQWTTRSITFKATAAQEGDDWIMFRTLETSGMFLSNCAVSDPIAETFLDQDTTLCIGKGLQLTGAGGSNFIYEWNTGATSRSIEVTEPGTYAVVITNFSCRSTDTVTVDFRDCEVRLNMPNVFTPDGDSRNPMFKPISHSNVVAGSVIIYNRWGENIYRGDLFQGWSGTVNGLEAHTGVYYYDALYVDADGKSHTTKGTVTLMRRQ